LEAWLIIDTTGNPIKLTLEEVRSATEFFAKELMPRAWDKLYVEIEFSRLDRVHGMVSRISRYEYQMDVSKTLGKKSTISTIAHEMVHIRQMFRGELVMKAAYSRWNGKDYPIGYDYFNSPWEIEAYGREVGLTHKYFTSMGKENK
jgi:hypothetical protein